MRIKNAIAMRIGNESGLDPCMRVQVKAAFLFRQAGQGGMHWYPGRELNPYSASTEGF
jgi:hypothetical protein